MKITKSSIFTVFILIFISACNSKPKDPCLEILTYSQIRNITKEDQQIARGLCDICMPLQCEEKCKNSSLDLKCRYCVGKCMANLGNFIDEQFSFEEE